MAGQPHKVVHVNCSNGRLLPLLILSTGWVILWLWGRLWLGVVGFRRRVLRGGLTSCCTVWIGAGTGTRTWTWNIGRRLWLGDSPICCYLGCSDTLIMVNYLPSTAWLEIRVRSRHIITSISSSISGCWGTIAGADVLMVRRNRQCV